MASGGRFSSNFFPAGFLKHLFKVNLGSSTCHFIELPKTRQQKILKSKLKIGTMHFTQWYIGKVKIYDKFI